MKTTSIADLTILELSVKCPKLGLVGTSFAITGDEIRSEDKGSPCDTLKMGFKQGLKGQTTAQIQDDFMNNSYSKC